MLIKAILELLKLIFSATPTTDTRDGNPYSEDILSLEDNVVIIPYQNKYVSSEIVLWVNDKEDAVWHRDKAVRLKEKIDTEGKLMHDVSEWCGQKKNVTTEGVRIEGVFVRYDPKISFPEAVAKQREENINAEVMRKKSEEDHKAWEAQRDLTYTQDLNVTPEGFTVTLKEDKTAYVNLDDTIIHVKGLPQHTHRGMPIKVRMISKNKDGSVRVQYIGVPGQWFKFMNLL